MTLCWLASLAALGGCAHPSAVRERSAPRSHGGTIVVVLQDRISGSFRQDGWELLIDGTQVGSCAAPAARPGPVGPVVAYEGYLAPGSHTVTALFRHRGHGAGVFSYLNRYVFQTRGTHALSIGPSRFVTLQVSAYERVGATTPLEERPAVDFQERQAAPDALLPRGCAAISPPASADGR